MADDDQPEVKARIDARVNELRQEAESKGWKFRIVRGSRTEVVYQTLEPGNGWRRFTATADGECEIGAVGNLGYYPPDGGEPIKYRAHKNMVGLILVLILMAGACFQAALNSFDLNPRTGALPAGVTLPPLSTPTAAGTLGDGTYSVPGEIEPGLWITSGSRCGWSKVDASGTPGSAEKGRGNVTVDSADLRILLVGGCRWTLSG